MVPGLPFTESSAVGVGVRSLFWYRSSYQNKMSSAVKGWPSDHLWPLRSENVNVLLPSLASQLLATEGTCFAPVKSANTSLSLAMIRLPFSPSPGPVKARRQMPPYLPISLSGLMTNGSSGTRCLTGGSLPALTSSASIGASPSFGGRFASGWMVGPSSLPINWLPRAGFASAGLAAGAVVGAAAGLGAAVGAAAGAAAAGALVGAGALAGAGALVGLAASAG